MSASDLLLYRFSTLLRGGDRLGYFTDPWLASTLARCDSAEFLALIRGATLQGVGLEALGDLARMLLLVRASGTLASLEVLSALLAAIDRRNSGSALTMLRRILRLSHITPVKHAAPILRETGGASAAIRAVTAMLATSSRAIAAPKRAKALATLLLSSCTDAVTELQAKQAAVLARRTARYYQFASRAGQAPQELFTATPESWAQQIWQALEGFREQLSARDFEQSVGLLCLSIQTGRLRRMANREQARQAVERVCPTPAGPFAQYLKASLLSDCKLLQVNRFDIGSTGCLLHGTEACPVCIELRRRRFGARPSTPAAVQRHVMFDLADAIIVSYPKCGRTWLRVFLNAYLFQGDRNGLDLFAKAQGRPGTPAVLMTHGNYPQYLDAATIAEDTRRYFQALSQRRVLVLVRDPRDVAVSFYFEMSRRLVWKPSFETDNLSLSRFLRSRVGGLVSILEYYRGIAAAREDGVDLSVIHYEDFLSAPDIAFAQLVDRIGAVPAAGTLAWAVSQSSLPRMRYQEHINHFGDRRLAAVDPTDLESFKTRRGGHGRSGQYLSATDRDWSEDLIRSRLPAVFARYLTSPPPLAAEASSADCDAER